MLVLRREQSKILSDDVRERAIKQYVHEKFPAKSERLGGRFGAVVESAVKRAGHYGLTAYQDVLRYAILTVVLGENFEERPDLDWAAEILADRTSPLSHRRAGRLYRTAIRHLKEERSA
jgi:hypothetical protein